MAATKLFPITATEIKALMYISDFQKTENGKHIFAYMCSKNPTEASHDFERTRMNGTGFNTILSQHLIQAFAPNEVTPEKAMQITNELCEKLLKGEYQYYLAVHTDKNHIHIYADTKIKETYFTENCDLHEEEYVYSDMNIHINNPLFCYNNIFLDGNVALNSNLGTLMNLNITGEVKNANTSVVYSKYGDITIENDSTANINGLIYAPLGTLTINSPNVNLNGVIIADKIVINGGSVNINYKEDIASFIGTESEVYDFSYLINLPESCFLDTDNDELFDFYEKSIDTDPFNPDTDGDGLPDGYEVVTLNTDPLEVDTDENGISDADEDFDSDNLNNLDEYQNKTEPFNPDTDEDGFLDGDEINKYKTDPLNPDTDNVGIKDGDEIKLGLDPLNPQTFGIPDSEYEVHQDITSDSDAFSAINTDENPFKISLQADASGCVESDITVEESAFSEIIDNDSIIGIAPEFQCEDTCKISKAVVKFNIDTEKIENNSEIFDEISELQGMKRFCIFKYHEDINMLLPVETSYDEDSDTIYTETEELGTYCVMDMESWISSFGFDEEEPYDEEQYQYPNEVAPMSIEEIPDENELTETEKEQCSVKVFDSNIDELFDESEEETAVDLPIQTYSNRSIITETNKTPLDVVFVLEQTGAQADAFNHQKKAIQYAARNIFALHSDVRIYIIGFKKDSASFYKATSLNYLVNTTQVNTALNKMSYTITNDYSNRGAAFNLLINNVSFRNYAAKFTFLILNGATTVKNGYKSQLDFCSKRDVNYSEVMASGYNYDKSYDNKVRKAVLKSNGIFIYDNKQLQFHILDHVIRNISTSNTQFDIAMPTSFRRISLKSPLSPTNYTDTDSDGLRDWAEADIKSGLIKWDSSGNVILPTLRTCLLKASNSDAVFRACINYAKYLPRSMNYILSSPVLPIHSNPCAVDSDEDGFNDKEDPKPLMKNYNEVFLSNKNYLGIKDNNNVSFGGNQGWLREYPYNTYCNGKISADFAAKKGCGLVAGADVLAYINIYNSKSMSKYAKKLGFTTTTTVTGHSTDLWQYLGYNKNSNTIDKGSYVHYLSLLSNKLTISDGSITGVYPFIIPTSLQSVFNDVFKTCGTSYRATWRKSGDFVVRFYEIERMLKKNIPVIFSFYNGFSNEKLVLYKKEKNNNYVKETDVASHYMVITGMIEYSDDVVDKVGHRRMLEISSWGKKYYIDYEQYSQFIGLFSNILYIS